MRWLSGLCLLMISSLLILLRLRLGLVRFMPLAPPIVFALALGTVLRGPMRAAAFAPV
jgi:hypothetical protein